MFKTSQTQEEKREVKARDVREKGKDTEDTKTQKRYRIKENVMVVWKESTTYGVSIVKGGASLDFRPIKLWDE